MTIAAHLVDDHLTVLVEVVDGALGPMSPESLGRRLLMTVERLVSNWDTPLRDVDLLFDGEDPVLGTGLRPHRRQRGARDVSPGGRWPPRVCRIELVRR